MARLTRRNEKGEVIEPRNRMEAWRMAKRLAAYEDTGLEPEEIERVMDAEKRTVRLRSDLSARLAATKDIPIDRLLDIAIAEADGRLVVLPPCKVGGLALVCHSVREDKKCPG